MKIGFEYQTSLVINEVNQDSTTISGTLLVEGITRNKRLYELSEMENIAKQAVGVPITTGIKRIVGADGLIRTLHDENPENTIGQIIKTIFQKRFKRILFVGRIWNSEKFPNIVNEVHQGWGISIGGMVQEAHVVFDKIKGKLMKIKDMLVQHVALIPPTISRGQQEAQVETVHECLMLYEDEDNSLTSRELGALIKALQKGGFL
jgi:hypothetical protein